VLLALSVVVGLVLALVTGGSWRGFAESRWRLAPLALAGLAIQLVLFSNNEALVSPLLPYAEELHLISYALVGAFLIANWRVPGLALLLAGAALNFVAIAANGGQMPRIVPPDPSVFSNVAAMDEGTRLWFLGDLIPFAGRIFSFGDVLIALGGGYAAFRLARPPRADHSPPMVLGRFR
jgi:hypothetical protein